MSQPRCDCEHAGHERAHRAGNCNQEADFYAVHHGQRQNLCANCMLFLVTTSDNQLEQYGKLPFPSQAVTQ